MDAGSRPRRARNDDAAATRIDRNGEHHRSMVKELRDKTGAGMMDCKAALSESGGDPEAAVDWLRKGALQSRQESRAGCGRRAHRRCADSEQRHGRRGEFGNRLRRAHDLFQAW